MPADLVRVLINGREFTGWTGVTITMSIDTMADAFSLSMPFDPDRADLFAALRPFGYQSAQIFIDDDLLLTGRVEKLSPSSDATERTISVEGRSLPGVLVDCGIEGDLQFEGMSLAQIARQLCLPFGILVRPDNDTEAIDAAAAEYGQTVQDFLNSIAAPRNFFLNSSFDGRLVLTSAAALLQRAPVAALLEGQFPVLAISAAYDATRRFSSYTVASQVDGDPEVSGQATDSGVPIHRPSLAPVKDTDTTDPSVTARRARTEAIAASCPIKATLAGWRTPGGQRWHERQTVTAQAPGVMLRTERRYLIAEATFKLDTASGKTVDLRLVMPETYAGEIPGVLPWAS